ncbi:hypothetical protein [Marinobacter flavimaris]|jgi:hypothetical protein|uniref:hypothetical protein n=1 Tax=Marinobacter flavimaris TaxID=262076 RepID=UPI003863FAFC|tara:strand:- start:2321 stop:2863 length:543 start_codon:yes stop_codon:yes gene_type:complete
MPIELRKVSKDVVAELQHQWLEPLSKLPDVPDAPYEMAVAWAEKSAESPSGTDVHCIYDREKEEALAIATFKPVFPNNPDGWLKVMNIGLSPWFDLRQPETEESNRFTRGKILGQIASSLVIGGLELATSVGVKKVKIYASNEITLEFFELVVSTMDTELYKLSELSVDTHGNWLVFTVG